MLLKNHDSLALAELIALGGLYQLGTLLYSSLYSTSTVYPYDIMPHLRGSANEAVVESRTKEFLLTVPLAPGFEVAERQCRMTVPQIRVNVTRECKMSKIAL